MGAPQAQPPPARPARPSGSRAATALLTVLGIAALGACSSARAEKDARPLRERSARDVTPSTAPATTSSSTTSTSTTAPHPAPTVPRPAIPAAPPAPAHVDGVFAIGDSVMLGAAGALRSRGIQVDAVESRQWGTGTAILARMAQAGRLPRTVVVHLGTNGPISSGQFDATMRVLAGHHVVFLTVHEPRSWEAEVNATLHAGVARWPGVQLLDWDFVSTFHQEWFWSDRIHLRPQGAQAYAALVAGAA
jgi:hypothetical protein